MIFISFINELSLILPPKLLINSKRNRLLNHKKRKVYYEKTPFKKQMRERTSSEFSVCSEATVPLSDSGDTGMFCIRALCL